MEIEFAKPTPSAITTNDDVSLADVRYLNFFFFLCHFTLVYFSYHEFPLPSGTNAFNVCTQPSSTSGFSVPNVIVEVIVGKVGAHQCNDRNDDNSDSGEESDHQQIKLNEFCGLVV